MELCNKLNNTNNGFGMSNYNFCNNINCCNKALFSNHTCCNKKNRKNLCNMSKVGAEDGFVRITNDGAFFLMFSVTMEVEGHNITLETDSFSINETVELPIYANSTLTKLQISVADIQVHWRLAFEINFNIPGDYCFIVRGLYESPNLTRIPCT